MRNRPIGGRSSETLSHPINMNMTILTHHVSLIFLKSMLTMFFMCFKERHVLVMEASFVVCVFPI
jgi:hypothetical protein